MSGTPMPLSDDEKEFLLSFYREFHPIMEFTAMKIVGAANAKDVVHDAILLLIPYLDKLRTLPPKARVTYAVRTVEHYAIRIVKEAKRLNINLFADPVVSQSPEDIVIQWETLEEYRTLIKQLPLKQQLLLYDRYFQEKSVSEIAASLKVKERKITVALQSIKRKLKRLRSKGGDKVDKRI